MRKALLWLGLAVIILGDDRMPQRQPILVELFTSEGCSTCPPADALLAKLDRDQPIAGAQIVVLSEHVDYWNQLGWTDPYSSAAFSARQETYARRFALDGPYTPEMVVDGATEFNGSDAHKAQSAILAALREPKVDIRIRPAEPDGSAVTLEVDPFPAGTKHKANVYVVDAADSGASDVLRGENQGRKLQHVSIAGEIQQVGSISERSGFTKRLPIRTGSAPAGSRLIAFVQESGNGRVWGVAMYPIPK